MADPDRPLLADFKEELSRLAADLREMIGLRWELARLEVQGALGTVKRLAVVLFAAAVMLLTALPVLIVYTAGILDEKLPTGSVSWFLILGLGLLVGAGFLGWFAWRRSRRQLVGLEETLEELHEDLVWLREWTAGEETDQAAKGEEP